MRLYTAPVPDLLRPLIAPFTTRLLLLAALLCSTALFASCGTTAEPRELTVLVGAGTGTSAVNAYFPSRVTIRAGDTVTWKMNTEADPHTVSFTDDPGFVDIVPLPGGQQTDFILNPDMLVPSSTSGEVEVHRGRASSTPASSSHSRWR